MRRIPVVQILVLTVFAIAAVVAAQAPDDDPLTPIIPQNLSPILLRRLRGSPLTYRGSVEHSV